MPFILAVIVESHKPFVVPAPPPYSPPRSQFPGPRPDESNAMSPATRVSPVYRNSPEPASNPVFHTPPPPPQRPWQGGPSERPQSLYNTPSSISRGSSDVPVPYLSPETVRNYTTPQLPPQTPVLSPEPLHAGEYHSLVSDSRPPAARRAVSASAVSTPSSSRTRSESTSGWAPGMPLPPPPPGPPPQSRSQSMNRTTDPMNSSLGPVPPTPADWVEEGVLGRGKSPARGLHIDTTNVTSSPSAPESNSGSSSSGLSRHHAIKGDPKSIRERRSESKRGKRIAEESSNNPWAEAITPSDSAVPPLTILGRRPTITKSTPRSSIYGKDTPRTGESSSHNTPMQGASRGTTPRRPAPTPPFSPGPDPNRSSLRDGSPIIPPKALPTPPPQRSNLPSPARPTQSSLYTSNDTSATVPILISRPGAGSPCQNSLPVSVAAEHFSRSAIERHQAFVTERSSCKSDDERVRFTTDTTWWNNYKPSLSPIPSMSVSEALDESDSRGRPSSRWWEVSDGGSNGNHSMRLERSKRESKYMGVPKELREKLQFAGDTIEEHPAGPSNRHSFGPNEYPPEKVGLHEQDIISTKLSKIGYSFFTTTFYPKPGASRSVNNNHPDLTSIRTTVRSLSDFTEIEATKTRFIKDSARMREENEAAASQRRNSMRLRISREIEAGTMTYADAAQMQDSSEAAEVDKTKEASKAEFQLFQEQVVGPLNTLLTDRIERASSLFEQLRSKISVEAQQNDPNSTQEEGDEQPELLEKLTLLKWIFEARELLHREVYDLLSDRNDRYKDMVTLPYKLAKNTTKIENAVKFFASDAMQRKLQNEQDILKRTEDFMDVVEKHVRDGVEALLNAFWDIAPGLSRITDKVPSNLAGFQIQIPAAEYDENPSYVDFPMQYLYSLLGHCEKSTYQFIESQTNLLCLLHEVKSGVTVANCRLMRTQRVSQGEVEEEVERELTEVEKDEEVRLTDDLKEKVRCVEELWSSGLGTELKGVKERIVEFLVERGGWMDEE
ncbi:hypothetical protein B0O99DRAFT_649222 [Bisporella sp. PMI_857]|nr:hypothetical protein B0O99DRAFT_649222 [Bisporella sp. PMI_857]